MRRPDEMYRSKEGKKVLCQRGTIQTVKAERATMMATCVPDNRGSKCSTSDAGWPWSKVIEDIARG